VTHDEVHSELIDAGKAGDRARRGFVEAQLGNPVGFVRAAALKVLTSYWEMPEHAETVFKALRDDRDIDVREAAAYALSHYGRGPSRALEAALALVLDDQEDELVRDAAYHSALVIAGVDRAQYPWRSTIPGFEACAEWRLLARLVATCGAVVPAALARRAEVGPSR